MPAKYGSESKLGIVVPALSDNANIVSALSQLFYGYKSDGTTLINGADANLDLTEVYSAKYSIAGYIRQLQVDKVNKAGNMTQFEQTTTPAELRGLISGTSGTGNLLFATTPTITTPVITSPTINTSIILPGSTSGNVTLTVPAVSGTTAIAFPATSGTVVTTGDTGTVTSTMILNDTIVNADVNANAAIAYSKLNLTGSIVNADIKSDAAIAISKLAASTISGISLGNNLNALTISSPLSGTSYNGSSAVTIALASGYGDTQNPYASKTQKFVLAAPNSADGVPTFRALEASDIPILNQDTTGTAASAISATTATKIAGGVAKNLLVQTGTGETGFVTNAAANGHLLQYTASGPAWVDYSTSGTITNAINAEKIATTASSSASTFYPTFVPTTTDGNQSVGNATNLTFVPSTGNLTSTKFNNLTLTAATTGFSIAGGTTSKTLTVAKTLTLTATNDTSTLNIGTGGTLTSLAFDTTAYQPLKTNLTTIGNLANAAGYLYNNGTGGFEYKTDQNTTYSQSAETTTGGAFLRLTGSDATTDDVKFAGSGATSITRTDANTITVASTNTTYTFASGTTNGAFSVTPSGGTAQSVSIYGLETLYAASGHVHGSITNDGKLGTTSGLVLGTTTGGAISAFTAAAPTSASTQFLRGDGTWVVPNNYYPTAVTISGTATAPTIGLSMSTGSPAVTAATIPVANGTTTAGIISTGAQIIGGAKTFSSTISGSIDGNADSATKAVAYSAASSTYPTTPGNRIFVGSVAPATASVGDIWMW